VSLGEVIEDVYSTIVVDGARLLLSGVKAGARALLPDLPVTEVPPRGRMVDLPGRGATYVVDLPGPTPDAPTVVLLHGLGVTASLCWAPTIAPLNEHARVVLFDQRWHGQGILSPHFTIEDCADDVDAVLEAIGVDRAIITGYSLGGAVAQMVWSRRPSRVSGLVLASTARNWQGKPGERFFFPVVNVLSRTLRPLSHRRASERFDRSSARELRTDDVLAWALDEMRSISGWSVAHALNAVGQFDSSPWVGRVDVPTAVVVTRGDHAIPSRRQHKLAAAIPGATVHEADGGHTALMFAADTWVPTFVGAVLEVAERAAAARAERAAGAAAVG
jgi:pimeloyl-ACP methyl ester carboxylesterase